MNPTANLSAAATNSIAPDDYQFLEGYIRRETGISLGPDKQYLLQSRLLPVLQEHRLGSFNELCLRLRHGVPESFRRRIVESMTTHETSFFRDPAVFEALRHEVLPRISAARQAAKTLRIWSAACSSGQEPYTLAMLLWESGFATGWKIEILGTDLSSKILARASAGRFLQIEVNRGLPAPLLIKYFHRVGLDWELNADVRRAVRFQEFDLRHSMKTLGPFDIVLCRNVLIYFDLPTRRQILDGLRSTLARDGYLVLGSSETTYNLDANFVRKATGNVAFYQNGAGEKR